jgi:4-alpha-glucanotransferase
MRRLHARMLRSDASDAAIADFTAFRSQASDLLRLHATYEAIQAFEFTHNADARYWRSWRDDLRDPNGGGVRAFATEHADEISFHMFLQWLSGKSYSAAQRPCRDAGMRIGLIADLAIGMDGAGSHAWSRQSDILQGLTIGAPPDYYSATGQDWALTTFSPRALEAESYAPFIDTLRASMRHVGGLRIDHVMGMNRLWLIPSGAKPTEGCYVSFPSEKLFRLMALESWRHKTIVIGEDLGTLPWGFREQLLSQGVAGLRVLRFERDQHGFRGAGSWDASAVALTMTHDLISTSGWWKGADLDPAPEGPFPDDNPHSIRGLLWAAFQNEGLVEGERPTPENAAPVVDAAVRFIARTACQLKVLTAEDALGVDDQPNAPGTITEKPNWRHRLQGDAADLLNREDAIRRMNYLAKANPRAPGA